MQGARCRVQGSGFRVQGSGCRVQGVGFRGEVAGLWVKRNGYRDEGEGVRVAGSVGSVHAREHKHTGYVIVDDRRLRTAECNMCRHSERMSRCATYIQT